jgi:hypothetical protein
MTQYKEDPDIVPSVVQPNSFRPSAPATKALPVLEISTFTLDRPLREVLKELGYADPDELRALRIQEDSNGQ